MRVFGEAFGADVIEEVGDGRRVGGLLSMLFRTAWRPTVTASRLDGLLMPNNDDTNWLWFICR